MAFNRDAAVKYLKENTLCNGLVLEYLDWTTGIGRYEREGFQRVYIMNQCGLAGTALKLVGDPLWTLIRDTMKLYLVKYGWYGSSKLRNYFYPILDQAVVPVGAAFKPNEEKILYDAPTVGDDEHPKQIILHTEPTDNLSGTCCSSGSITPRSNTALMRAMHHWDQGDESQANDCYDCVLENRRPEDWHLADEGIDFSTTEPFLNVWKYRTYKQLIQWMAAKRLGRPRLYTDVLDMTQDTVHGGVRTFYKKDYTLVHTPHNTETTALAVIADVMWNGL